MAFVSVLNCSAQGACLAMKVGEHAHEIRVGPVEQERIVDEINGLIHSSLVGSPPRLIGQAQDSAGMRMLAVSSLLQQGDRVLR